MKLWLGLWAWKYLRSKTLCIWSSRSLNILNETFFEVAEEKKKTFSMSSKYCHWLSSIFVTCCRLWIELTRRQRQQLWKKLISSWFCRGNCETWSDTSGILWNWGYFLAFCSTDWTHLFLLIFVTFDSVVFDSYNDVVNNQDVIFISFSLSIKLLFRKDLCVPGLFYLI